MKLNGKKTTQALCAILCAFLIIGCSTLFNTADTQVKADLGPMYEEGTGREDISLAILRPRGIDLAPEQDKYLDILQGALFSDFNKFSAITLSDTKNIEVILNQQQLSLSGNYSETDYIEIGKLLNAKFILAGTLTKIDSTQFDLYLSLTNLESGELIEVFQKIIKLRELINYSASRAVAADILPRLDVVFTPAGKLALETVLSAEETESQNALALSYEASRSGNLIDALIYSYAAEDADKNSAAARQQASEVFARMGGSGSAIKEDIKRQEFWKKNLTAFEDFYRTHHPFELVYTAIDISKGVTDYDSGTTNFEFYVGLRHKSVATMQKVLNDILKELRQTDYKKNKWGFDNWPGISATSTKSNQIHTDIFNNYLTFNITAALLNDDDEIIARLEFPLYGQLVLSGRSAIGAFSTQERRMTLTVPNDMVLQTDNIYFRVISIDTYDADTANVNKYLRNSVVARMPVKSRISIPSDKQLVPELPEEREKRLVAQQKERERQEEQARRLAEQKDRQREREARKVVRERKWDTMKLSGRGNLAAGVTYNPAFKTEWANALAIEAGLGLGYKNFSIDGRLVYPVDGSQFVGFGAALGYSYVWDNFMASMEGGATWYRHITGNSATVIVPTLEGKFDIVPWKPGLGLRLGYKLEFGSPTNTATVRGTPAAGLVLWF